MQIAEEYAGQSGRQLPVTGYLYSLMSYVLCNRTHIKNIYGKLDVHNRGEAVVRAQDLGLL